MKNDEVFEISTFEEVIVGLLNVRSGLESEVYELESAIRVAKEYAFNRDMDFMRYLDILGEKCGKIKALLEKTEDGED